MVPDGKREGTEAAAAEASGDDAITCGRGGGEADARVEVPAAVVVGGELFAALICQPQIAVKFPRMHLDEVRSPRRQRDQEHLARSAAFRVQGVIGREHGIRRERAIDQGCLDGFIVGADIRTAPFLSRNDWIRSALVRAGSRCIADGQNEIPDAAAEAGGDDPIGSRLGRLEVDARVAKTAAVVIRGEVVPGSIFHSKIRVKAGIESSMVDHIDPSRLERRQEHLAGMALQFVEWIASLKPVIPAEVPLK